VLVWVRKEQENLVLVALNANREPVTLDVRVDELAPNGTRLVEEWSREEIMVQDGFARGIQLAARTGALFAA